MRCALCGRDDRPMTREHVFARWLTQRFGSAGAARVIAPVCADCNAGWMSTLEVGFRRLVTGPRTGPIAAADRLVLARWFTKTATLVGDAQGALLVDASRRAALLRDMPDGVEVAIARRRRLGTRIGYAVDRTDGVARSVTIFANDLVAHVAPVGTLGSRHGTQLWPQRTRLLRWDTLPVVSALT